MPTLDIHHVLTPTLNLTHSFLWVPRKRKCTECQYRCVHVFFLSNHVGRSRNDDQRAMSKFSRDKIVKCILNLYGLSWAIHRIFTNIALNMLLPIFMYITSEDLKTHLYSRQVTPNYKTWQNKDEGLGFSSEVDQLSSMHEILSLVISTVAIITIIT
jgi:hypothetical protein